LRIAEEEVLMQVSDCEEEPINPAYFTRIQQQKKEKKLRMIL